MPQKAGLAVQLQTPAGKKLELVPGKKKVESPTNSSPSGQGYGSIGCLESLEQLGIPHKRFAFEPTAYPALGQLGLAPNAVQQEGAFAVVVPISPRY